MFAGTRIGPTRQSPTARARTCGCRPASGCTMPASALPRCFAPPWQRKQQMLAPMTEARSVAFADLGVRGVGRSHLAAVDPQLKIGPKRVLVVVAAHLGTALQRPFAADWDDKRARTRRYVGGERPGENFLRSPRAHLNGQNRNGEDRHGPKKSLAKARHCESTFSVRETTAKNRR
jgi:hypothetical protein